MEEQGKELLSVYLEEGVQEMASAPGGTHKMGAVLVGVEGDPAPMVVTVVMASSL